MLVLFNSILSKADMLSGGAQIAIDYLKTLDTVPTIVMPSDNSKLIENQLACNCVLWNIFSDNNNHFKIILRWFKLAIGTCKLQLNEDIFTTTDDFCNTYPAYKIKGLHHWTACVFHVIPFHFGRIIPFLLQRFSLRLICKQADKIMVLNELTKSQLIQIGFNKDKIALMPVSVNEKLIQSIRVDDKPYDACFLGRLSPAKGIFDLPKIWEGLTGKLLIIGAGGFKNDRERLFEMCADKPIFFSGYKDGEEKYVLMKSSKVFILPSYEEGLSLAIKEALACNLPVVVWDLPVYKTAYGDKLHLVPRGNIKAFREKIQELIG